VAGVESLAYQQVPHPAGCPEHGDPQGASVPRRDKPLKNPYQ
jgi:hypothetical protein